VVVAHLTDVDGFRLAQYLLSTHPLWLLVHIFLIHDFCAIEAIARLWDGAWN